MTATEITKKINAAGYKYYGETARAWEADGFGRIYFGRDFVTVEASGEIHNCKSGKARAMTIGDTAVDAIAKIIGQ